LIFLLRVLVGDESETQSKVDFGAENTKKAGDDDCFEPRGQL